MPEQAAEKAGGMGRLLASLLGLLLQLRDLGLGLLERDVLDEDRLRENVNRVGIVGQLLVEQGFGVGIFFLELCLVDSLGK